MNYFVNYFNPPRQYRHYPQSDISQGISLYHPSPIYSNNSGIKHLIHNFSDHLTHQTILHFVRVEVCLSAFIYESIQPIILLFLLHWFIGLEVIDDILDILAISIQIVSNVALDIPRISFESAQTILRCVVEWCTQLSLIIEPDYLSLSYIFQIAHMLIVLWLYYKVQLR